MRVYPSKPLMHQARSYVHRGGGAQTLDNPRVTSLPPEKYLLILPIRVCELGWELALYRDDVT